MKISGFLSVISLMAAFAAFTTSADAKKVIVDISEGCETPECQAQLESARCHLDVIRRGRHTDVESNCTPEEFDSMMQELKQGACASCTIHVTAK